MICILPTSGLEKVVSSYGAETSKAMMLLGERPVCASLLDELQRLEEFFDKIILVGSGLKEFEDWARFGMHDEFFKTKFLFLKDDNAANVNDDIWAAFEWMSEKDWNPETLIVSPDICVRDIGKLVDGSLGSYRAYAHGSPIGIWKLKDFAEAVNAMVLLNSEGKWSMESLTEKMMERGSMEALDITDSILKLNTRGDYIAAWKEKAPLNDGGPLAYDINTDRQTIKLSNAWKSKKWTPSIWNTERTVQSALWDCWNFLENASSMQKSYLPTPINRGPDVRGEYCNWIELELIPDSSVQALMMGRQLDKESWSEIMDKTLNILEESFWSEQEPDWRSDADRKDRTRLLERLSDKWSDLVQARISTFSLIKWDTLVKRHLEWMESHVKDRKAVFHNGTGGRLVHGNLTLKTILCNWQTLDIHFVDPANRTGILVDAFEDYAGLYLDCWCLLPVFIHGRHVDMGAEGLDVPDYIADNAFEIESILDARLGEKAVHAKIEALMLALELFDLVPIEHQKAFMAFLQYRANELYVGSVHTRATTDNLCKWEENHYARCPKATRTMPCMPCRKENPEWKMMHDRMYWKSNWKIHHSHHRKP